MQRKLLVLFALFVLASAIILGKLFVLERHRLDTRSVDSLRTIYDAQSLYARSHPDKGFASSLAELGPYPGDALIDSLFASGRKSGYVFILSAAPPDSNGRVMHYTLVVRPETYVRENRSFFMDESGVERFTTENRTPTANDPVLN